MKIILLGLLVLQSTMSFGKDFDKTIEKGFCSKSLEGRSRVLATTSYSFDVAVIQSKKTKKFTLMFAYVRTFTNSRFARSQRTETVGVAFDTSRFNTAKEAEQYWKSNRKFIRFFNATEETQEAKDVDDVKLDAKTWFTYPDYESFESYDEGKFYCSL